jgi:ABC-type transport system involved in multi-copper enzyme maturation permease subunit
MDAIWKNPEFVRHLRANLRRTRAIAVAATVVAICLLIWLGCWGSKQSELAAMRRGMEMENFHWSPERLTQMERDAPIEVWLSFFKFMMYAQLGVLTFWSLLSCAQSISGERERRTWDFQRATRLTAGEILIGKLVGEPILAYFIVLCCLPQTILAGLLGEAGWRSIAGGYLLILTGALFIGLTGLWLSNLFERRSRGVGLIGTFGLYLLFGLATQLSQDSNFPGLGAFSPLAGLLSLFREEPYRTGPTIFGTPVSWLSMSLLLYATFGAWFVLMLLRTLKKDYDQLHPLSRWETVGCAAFIIFTSYALFFPRPWYRMDPIGFARFMVGLNGLVLFALGLVLLTPPERLKVWHRKKTGMPSLLAEDGLAWPWVLISALVGYLLLVWGMFAWKYEVGFEQRALAIGLLLYVVIGLFVTRDILFLQWCRLTRLRAPVLKGALYLGLYYVAIVVLSTVVNIFSEERSRAVYALMTPVGAFYFGSASDDLHNSHLLFVQIVFGLAIQSAVVWTLLARIKARLSDQ